MYQNIQLPYVNETDISEFYSRYVDLGFSKKFEQIYAYNPDFKISLWFENFTFSPFPYIDISTDGTPIEQQGFRHMKNFLVQCILCFWFGFIIEFLSFKRFNKQAKPLLMDHNPLVVKRALGSRTAEIDPIDPSFQPINYNTGEREAPIGQQGIRGLNSAFSKK